MATSNKKLAVQFSLELSQFNQDVDTIQKRYESMTQSLMKTDKDYYAHLMQIGKAKVELIKTAAKAEEEAAKLGLKVEEEKTERTKKGTQARTKLATDAQKLANTEQLKLQQELTELIIQESKVEGDVRVSITKKRIDKEIELEKQKLEFDLATIQKKLVAEVSGSEQRLKLQQQYMQKQTASATKVSKLESKKEGSGGGAGRSMQTNFRAASEFAENISTVSQNLVQGNVAGLLTQFGGMTKSLGPASAVLGTTIDLLKVAGGEVQKLADRSEKLSGQWNVLANTMDMKVDSKQFNDIKISLEGLSRAEGQTKEKMLELAVATTEFEKPENLKETMDVIMSINKMSPGTSLEEASGPIEKFVDAGVQAKDAGDALALTIRDMGFEAAAKLPTIFSKASLSINDNKKALAESSSIYAAFTATGMGTKKALTASTGLFEELNKTIQDPAALKTLTSALPQGFDLVKAGLEEGNVSVVKFVDTLQKMGPAAAPVIADIKGPLGEGLGMLTNQFERTGQSINKFAEPFQNASGAANGLVTALRPAIQMRLDEKFQTWDDAAVTLGTSFKNLSSASMDMGTSAMHFVSSGLGQEILRTIPGMEMVTDLFVDSGLEAEKAFQKFQKVSDVTQAYNELKDTLLDVQSSMVMSEGDPFVAQVTKSLKEISAIAPGAATELEAISASLDSTKPEEYAAGVERMKQVLGEVGEVQAANEINALNEALSAGNEKLKDLEESTHFWGESIIETAIKSQPHILAINEAFRAMTGIDLVGDTLDKFNTSITQQVENSKKKIEELKQARDAAQDSGNDEKSRELAEQLNEEYSNKAKLIGQEQGMVEGISDEINKQVMLFQKHAEMQGESFDKAKATEEAFATQSKMLEKHPELLTKIKSKMEATEKVQHAKNDAMVKEANATVQILSDLSKKVNLEKSTNAEKVKGLQIIKGEIQARIASAKAAIAGLTGIINGNAIEAKTKNQILKVQNEINKAMGVEARGQELSVENASAQLAAMNAQLSALEGQSGAIDKMIGTFSKGGTGGTVEAKGKGGGGGKGKEDEEAKKREEFEKAKLEADKKLAEDLQKVEEDRIAAIHENEMKEMENREKQQADEYKRLFDLRQVEAERIKAEEEFVKKLFEFAKQLDEKSRAWLEQRLGKVAEMLSKNQSDLQKLNAQIKKASEGASEEVRKKQQELKLEEATIKDTQALQVKNEDAFNRNRKTLEKHTRAVDVTTNILEKIGKLMPGIKADIASAEARKGYEKTVVEAAAKRDESPKGKGKSKGKGKGVEGPSAEDIAGNKIVGAGTSGTGAGVVLSPETKGMLKEFFGWPDEFAKQIRSLDQVFVQLNKNRPDGAAKINTIEDFGRLMEAKKGSAEQVKSVSGSQVEKDTKAWQEWTDTIDNAKKKAMELQKSIDEGMGFGIVQEFENAAVKLDMLYGKAGEQVALLKEGLDPNKNKTPEEMVKAFAKLSKGAKEELDSVVKEITSGRFNEIPKLIAAKIVDMKAKIESEKSAVKRAELQGELDEWIRKFSGITENTIFNLEAMAMAAKVVSKEISNVNRHNMLVVRDLAKVIKDNKNVVNIVTQALEERTRVELGRLSNEERVTAEILNQKEVIYDQIKNYEIIEEKQGKLTEEQKEDLERLRKGLKAIYTLEPKKVEEAKQQDDDKRTAKIREYIGKLQQMTDLLIEIPDHIEAIEKSVMIGGAQGASEVVGKVSDIAMKVGQALLSSKDPQIALVGAFIVGAALIGKAVAKIIGLFKKLKLSSSENSQLNEDNLERVNSLYETRLKLMNTMNSLQEHNLDQARELFAEEVRLYNIKVQTNARLKEYSQMSASDTRARIEGLDSELKSLMAIQAEGEKLKEGGSRVQMGDFLERADVKALDLGARTGGSNKNRMEEVIERIKARVIELNGAISDGEAALQARTMMMEYQKKVVEEEIDLIKFRMKLDGESKELLDEIAEKRKKTLVSAMVNVGVGVDMTDTTDQIRDALSRFAADENSVISPAIIDLANSWMEAEDAAKKYGGAQDDLFEKMRELLNLRKELEEITEEEFKAQMLALLKQRLVYLDDQKKELIAQNAEQDKLLQNLIDRKKIELDIKNLLNDQTGGLSKQQKELSKILKQRQLFIWQTRTKGTGPTSSDQSQLSAYTSQAVAKLTEMGRSESEIKDFLDSLPQFESGGETGQGGLAMTHPGEFILNKDAVNRLGANYLSAFNKAKGSLGDMQQIGLGKMDSDKFLANSTMRKEAMKIIMTNNFIFNQNMNFANMSPTQAQQQFGENQKQLVKGANKAISAGLIGTVER